MKKKILVLMGGISGEREISLLSGRACVKALRRKKYKVQTLDPKKDFVNKIRKLNNELGTCLIYELTVQGCLGMPVGLIERRLREDLSSNLLAVEKEAFSRQENLARLINS